MNFGGLRILIRFLRLRALAWSVGVGGLAVGGIVAAQPAADKPAPVTVAEEKAKPLPISLDAVFHLAEEQNGQIAVARERVTEAYASKDLAAKSWLPDAYVGPAYYRHEGGIQNEDGRLTHSSSGALFGGLEFYSRVDLREAVYTKVNAQRQIWQHKGELTKVTTETLLEAANTYIDLLTARTGEAIALDLEKSQQELLQEVDDLAKEETGLKFLAEGVRSARFAQKQKTIELHRQGDAAGAKLVYLLCLGPCTEVQPLDGKLLPLDLVDASPPCCDLVSQAWTSGPGIHEMEGLLAAIQEGLDKSKGLSRYLPILEMSMAEGAFGAGPGDDVKWDNRFELGLHARWSLGEYMTSQDRLRIAHSKLRQAHLTYQDLRAKLSAGVQEARESSLSGKEQIHLTAEQVKHATEAYKLSKLRLKENVKGSSPAEVLGTLQNLAAAQISHVTAINAYDKAQLRLMLLLGPSACTGAAAPIAPPSVKAAAPTSIVPAALDATPPVPSAPKPPVQPAVQRGPTGWQQGLDALNDAQTHFRRRRSAGESSQQSPSP
jgi:outer membrane protein TolC